MLQAGIPKHVVFQFIRFCILTKVNWGAFVDEDKYQVETLYNKIDELLLGMIHETCMPHVVEIEEIGYGCELYKPKIDVY